MRKVAISNQKGGVGKTTTAINLSSWLHRKGFRVLAVDLDHQANLTTGLGINPAELKMSVWDLLTSQAKFEEVAIDRAGLHVIPSNIKLSSADLVLGGEVGRDYLLKQALQHADYDYIIIDCPPSLGLMTINAFTFVNELVIPVQSEFYALQGLGSLLQAVELTRQRLNPVLEIAGVLCTLFDGRKNLHKEAVEFIRNSFSGHVFETVIRDNIALAEAPSHGQSIFEYAPNSHGAEDYGRFGEEFILLEEGIHVEEKAGEAD